MIVDNDFAILRNFHGQCSLATYLTVISRRIVVRELLARKTEVPLGAGARIVSCRFRSIPSQASSSV